MTQSVLINIQSIEIFGVELPNIEPKEFYTCKRLNKKNRKVYSIKPQYKDKFKALYEFVTKSLKCWSKFNFNAKNKGILKNAQIHYRSKYFYKADIKNYFSSITKEQAVKFLKSGMLIYMESEIRKLVELLFIDDTFITGTPLSNFIGNNLLNIFDKQLYSGLLSVFDFTSNIRYTRYTDDLMISSTTPLDIDKINILYRAIMAKQRYDFSLKGSGFAEYHKGEKVKLLGLYISTDQRITVGKKRKRICKAYLHKLQYENNYLERYKMKCFIHWCCNNDLLLANTLRKKYGKEYVEREMNK